MIIVFEALICMIFMGLIFWLLHISNPVTENDKACKLAQLLVDRTWLVVHPESEFMGWIDDLKKLITLSTKKNRIHDK